MSPDLNLTRIESLENELNHALARAETAEFDLAETQADLDESSELIAELRTEVEDLERALAVASEGEES